MTTMIAGCAAKAEALSPHFQFQTKAKTDDRARIRMEVAKYTLNVCGQFSLPEMTTKPSAFGLNEKGGMDDAEFEEYLMNSIVPFWPNVKPVKGYWVIIKADSGPGRLNASLLARLRQLSFILYPVRPTRPPLPRRRTGYGHVKHILRDNLQSPVATGKIRVKSPMELC